MKRVFRNYEISEKLGSGGMASVYRGRHLTLDSPVAIKILHRELAFDDTFISRFELEARAAAALDSPHIVKVIDFGSEDDVYFIVMEFVEGEDLGQVTARLRTAGVAAPLLPPEISLLILTDVAVGLKAAHARRIIHRDIKPSNILLDHQGQVRIADFGLARDGRPVRDLGLTRTGTVLGTPAYMSPEQASGEVVDHRTDVFSLGVVAYELLAGRKPFTGNTPSEILQQIIEVPPPVLDEHSAPWIADDMGRLLERALAKDPEKRFADMEALLGALRDCQASLDPGGQLARTKYDVLRGFATDVMVAHARIRKQSIDNHLRRGLRFKDMGMAKLQDALYELRYVAALDPDNAKARQVLRKLEKKARESAGSLPAPGTSDDEASTIRTTVLSPDWNGRAPTEPMPVRPARRRRWPWVLVALLVVAAVAVLGGQRWLERPDEAPGEQTPILATVLPDSAVPTASDSTAPDTLAMTPEPLTPQEGGAGEPDGDTETAAITDTGQEAAPAAPAPVIVEQEPAPPPSPPAPGRLRFFVPDSCRVSLDGEEIFHGQGEHVVEMAAGRSHHAVFHFPRTQATVDHPGLVVGTDRERDLGRVEPALGILQFAANMDVDLTIDGRLVSRSGRLLRSHVIGAGEHVLSAEREGYEVREAVIDNVPMEQVVGPTGRIGYRFTIDEDREHRIWVLLR